MSLETPSHAHTGLHVPTCIRSFTPQHIIYRKSRLFCGNTSLTWIFKKKTQPNVGRSIWLHFLFLFVCLFFFRTEVAGLNQPVNTSICIIVFQPNNGATNLYVWAFLCHITHLQGMRLPVVHATNAVIKFGVHYWLAVHSVDFSRTQGTGRPYYDGLYSWSANCICCNPSKWKVAQPEDRNRFCHSAREPGFSDLNSIFDLG